jgi:histidyl-tRNA synthetase
MEAIGWAGPQADAEVILAGARIWKDLGVKDVHLTLNSLGSDACRARYREALVAYLNEHRDELDSDSQRRLERNPLRILDSKNQNTQKILADAPVIEAYLDAPARQHFDQLLRMLTDAKVSYTIDAGLVRGLDYYTSIVFEWKTGKLGAQNTVCAGGRYDNLVESNGGRSTPACGFAMGMERLVELLVEENAVLEVTSIDAYIVSLSEASNQIAMQIAESLRDQGVSTAMNHGLGKLKSQLKKADSSGAKIALIIGEAELEQRVVQLKPLRGQAPSKDIAINDLSDYLKTNENLIHE